MGRWQSWFAAVAMAVGAMIGTPALAQNLVVNPGFEAGGGSFTGWTQDAGASNSIGTTATHSGAARANLGSFNSLAGISQTIATQAGKTYTFSFYFRGVGVDGAGNQFQASFDGQTVYNNPAVSANGGTYFFQTFDRVASTGSTTISFKALNDSGNISLDDISVAAAPELATWAMMIFGFGMIGVALRRRRGTAMRHGMLLRA